ncbi:hypothetical protein SGLAM104S_01148 [Streptomyces glaucescens]
MSLLPARRLMAADVALVAIATVVRPTVPAARTPLRAGLGLASPAAVLTGVPPHRPAPSSPRWVRRPDRSRS